MTTTSIQATQTFQADLQVHQPPVHKPFPNRWSHGRGYLVIAAISPLILASLVWIYLHQVALKSLQSIQTLLSAPLRKRL